MFQLTADEAEALRFQFGSLKRGQHFKSSPRVDDAPIKSSLAQFLYIKWRLTNGERDFANHERIYGN
jgi:hypothetical protein